MITREEALSKVEGYLYQVKDSCQILAVVDEQVKLLCEKLTAPEGHASLSGGT